MMARAMEVVVDTIMSNHFFQFDGQVFKQETGGPFGLEITGVLARLVMLSWDEKFLGKWKHGSLGSASWYKVYWRKALHPGGNC